MTEATHYEVAAAAAAAPAAPAGPASSITSSVASVSSGPAVTSAAAASPTFVLGRALDHDLAQCRLVAVSRVAVVDHIYQRY